MAVYTVNNCERIKALEYDNASLIVHMTDNSQWLHYNVLPETFNELINSRSVREYYEQNIEGNRQYRHRKIAT